MWAHYRTDSLDWPSVTSRSADFPELGGFGAQLVVCGESDKREEGLSFLVRGAISDQRQVGDTPECWTVLLHGGAQVGLQRPAGTRGGQ